jgi:hypothetical protein
MTVFDIVPHLFLVFQDGIEQQEFQTQAEAETHAELLFEACSQSCMVSYIEPGNRHVAVIAPPPPPPGELPSWLEAAQDHEWISLNAPIPDPLEQFPSWSLGEALSGADYHTGIIDGWSGAVATDDSLVVGLVGGHRGSAQNTIYKIRLDVENPDWQWYGTDPALFDVPSHHPGTIADWINEERVPYYSDGRPTAAHTYNHLAYVPSGDYIFRPYAIWVWSGSQNTTGRQADAAAYFLSGVRYAVQGEFPDYPARLSVGGLTEWNPATQSVWSFNTSGPGDGPRRGIMEFDPSAKVWTVHGTVASGSYSSDTQGGTIDPGRQIMLVNTTAELVVIAFGS